MSYTTLYKVCVDGQVKPHERYYNSYQNAFSVWDSMAKQYLHRDVAPMLNSNMWELFNLWKNPLIPIGRRIVLMATFDHVLVRQANIAKLVAAHEEHWSFFSSIPCFGRRALFELLQDVDCVAVCWQQTSVSQQLWWVNGEDCQEGRPYNVFVDKDHWFLFDELVTEQAVP
jgi:hypothetical protein